jgi:hypothetical protein
MVFCLPGAGRYTLDRSHNEVTPKYHPPRPTMKPTLAPATPGHLSRNPDNTIQHLKMLMLRASHLPALDMKKQISSFRALVLVPWRRRVTSARDPPAPRARPFPPQAWATSPRHQRGSREACVT